MTSEIFKISVSKIETESIDTIMTMCKSLLSLSKSDIDHSKNIDEIISSIYKNFRKNKSRLTNKSLDFK